MYLRKKGNRWYFAVTVTMMDGTRKRLEKVGGRTKAEARKAAVELLKLQDEQGRIFIAENMRVAEFYDQWLHLYAEVHLKPNTVELYRNIIDNHLKELGNARLVNLTPLALQKFINKKRESCGLSLCRGIVAVLKKGLKDAKDIYNYVSINPAAGLKVPAGEDTDFIGEDIINVFSREQVTAILARFEHTPLMVPVMLSYHTGMRIGECLALSWEDVHFDSDSIYVRATQYDKKYIQLTRTKNLRSRIIVIGKTLKDFLIEVREKQIALFGNAPVHVCCNNDGSRMTSNNIRYFNMWCKDNHMNGSFHTLRHTHICQLLEAGVEIDYVSKRAGHASVSVTSRTYSHLTEKRHDNALKVINRIL